MTQEEYTKTFGTKCPACGSDDLDHGSVAFGINTLTASQDVWCLTCGAEWDDIFELKGYANLTLNKE